MAVDVPGVMSIRESATQATHKKLVFFADYQIPADPANQEVLKRIAAGNLGKLQTIFSAGAAGGDSFQDIRAGR